MMGLWLNNHLVKQGLSLSLSVLAAEPLGVPGRINMH